MTDQKKQFDSLLGGEHSLPDDVNIFKFAVARAKEIEVLEDALKNPSSTKLIFQKLPIHMRRRVMSHNSKRLPRRLREAHLNQLAKSGTPSTSQKRPSRKYRRRPANLQSEYVRRQRRIKWLETHIWHAKRFHMIERWGYKLADRPCDKSYRALYRGSARHCLLQDISYFNCIELSGPGAKMIDYLKKLIDPSVQFHFGSKCYVNGQREGHVTLYYPNAYPSKPIGDVTFLWKPENGVGGHNRKLWIWTHPSFRNELINQLKDLFDIKNENLTHSFVITDLSYDLNRYRLTGPLSHVVLKRSFQLATAENITDENWFKPFTELSHKPHEFWNELNISSPGELPPRIVLGLTITDPRFNMPSKRTKAMNSSDYELSNVPSLTQSLSSSPIWDSEVRQGCIKDKLTDKNICDLKSEQLVPGQSNLLIKKFATTPLLLIQRPGDQESYLGYGSGYDIIVPNGWGLPLWRTLIMWGARAGGLREDRVSILENQRGQFLAPDTNAGIEECERREKLLCEKYFRLPPNKRVNYIKYGIVSPFRCRWDILTRDWTGSNNFDYFYCLRNVLKLKSLQESLNKQKSGEIEENTKPILIPVKLKLLHKGLVKDFSIICLPNNEDLENKISPVEQTHVDINQIKRRELRIQHQKLLKRLKRKRVQIRRKMRLENKYEKIKFNDTAAIIAEYSKQMRQLWLPEPHTIRHSCSRQVIGYVTHGDYSFKQAKSCAVGYVTIQSLSLINNRQVLVRNTTNQKYRYAFLDIIC